MQRLAIECKLRYYGWRHTVVSKVQKKSFGARNIAEKQEIIRKGRPTPVLKNKIKTQIFHKKMVLANGLAL